MRRAAAITAIFGACALGLAGPANAGLIDFRGFVHGQVIDDEYFTSDGVTISADNPNRSFDLAVVFSTVLAGTRDGDLEGPPWASGNAAAGHVFGNILIVQENDNGCADQVCNRPDDEGSNPGGDLIFAFETRIESFGFDVIDFESSQAGGAQVLFFDGAGPAVASVGFGEFACAAGPFCDPTVQFGNNSANHLADLGAAALGLTGFDRVVIDLNGSGGVDNVRWSVPGPVSAPEPALGWLLLPALALAARSRAA